MYFMVWLWNGIDLFYGNNVCDWEVCGVLVLKDFIVKIMVCLYIKKYFGMFVWLFVVLLVDDELFG